MNGQILTFLAVALQSFGKVLYGTLLIETPTIVFLLYSFALAAVVFLAISAFRLPKGGRHLVLKANFWTALTFLAFFYALKHLSPGTVGCLEIVTSIIVAAVFSKVRGPMQLSLSRATACAAMAFGAVLLMGVEWKAGVAKSGSIDTALALGACFVAGAASAFMANTSKALANAGWSSSSVLAHRFYGTIVLSIIWLAFDSTKVVAQPPATLLAIFFVSVTSVLAPLFLIQKALRTADTLTILICTALQPLLSLLFSFASPSYGWNPIALAGVGMVSVGLIIDLSRKQQNVEKAVAA